MTRIASEDDFLALVDRHFPREHAGVLLGRGDDAAVVDWPGAACVTTDLFLEDVHFRRAYFAPEDVGYKSVAVNVSDVAAMQMALGTSLATIVFTSIASYRAHDRRGAVRWDIFKSITPGILVGSFLGSWIAAKLSTTFLKGVFVVFLYYVSIQMLLNIKPKPSRQVPQTGGMRMHSTAIRDRCKERHSWTPRSGCSRTNRNSSGVSRPGFRRIARGMSSLPASWSKAPTPAWTMVALGRFRDLSR